MLFRSVVGFIFIFYNAVVVVVVVVGHGPVHNTANVVSSCFDISHKRLDCWDHPICFAGIAIVSFMFISYTLLFLHK